MRPDAARNPRPTHAIALCGDGTLRVRAIARFVQDAVALGDGVLVITTLPCWDAVRAVLETRGVDVAGALGAGRVLVVDAEAMLDRILDSSSLGADVLEREVQPALAQLRAATGSEVVRAFGDVANLLWARGDHGLALALERAWHDLLGREEVTLMCAYDADPLDPSHDAAALLSLCRSHGHVELGDDGPRRAEAIRTAIAAEMEPQMAARLDVVLAGEGIPAGAHHPELAVLWLRTQMPHLARRVVDRARRALSADGANAATGSRAAS
jgi:hypothetical protein